MKEKKVITRKDWVSTFNLIGKPVINDYTFKVNERSERSNWIYNAMNLGVDCGEKYGVIYGELMGGYSEVNENKIFAHGKKDDNSDDFEKQIVIDWEDRFNDAILEEVGSMSFMDVGLERTDKGNLFVKHFLSAYDAIAYIKEHLSADTVINVKGNIKYSLYNDTVQVRKNITSIVLSKADDPSKYKATFTQSILIDKDSASLKNIDKDKGVMYVDAKVLDYVKEINGIEVKGQYPYNKQFEFEMDFNNEAQCKKVMDKLFKVKKGITQITFEGDFIESGATVKATREDLPQDIIDLIDMGVYDEEEALAKCTVNGGKERRMVLRKPQIKMVGNDDNKMPVVQKFEERYTEDDLVLDYLFENNDTDYPADDEPPFDTEEASGDSSMDWLNAL